MSAPNIELAVVDYSFMSTYVSVSICTKKYAYEYQYEYNKSIVVHAVDNSFVKTCTSMQTLMNTEKVIKNKNR